MTNENDGTSAESSPAIEESIRFSYLLGDSTRWMRRAYDREMQKLGLTRAQWRMLLAVLHKRSPTQSELAEMLDIGRASAGVLIRQLEDKGYLQRHEDDTDGRVRRVRPSKRAVDSAAQMTDLGNTAAEKLFAGISPEDLETATQVLKAIKANARVGLG